MIDNINIEDDSSNDNDKNNNNIRTLHRVLLFLETDSK